MSVSGLTRTLFGGRAHAYLSDEFDDVLFNVVSDESITDNNEITPHAIEEGADVEDHIIGKPTVFTLNIVLSDDTIDVLDPMSVVNKFTATIQDRIEIMDRWKNEKTVLTYYAIESDNEDVVIQSLTRRRSLDLGTGMGFSLTLMHVNIVDSETVNIKTNTAKPATKKTTGKSGEMRETKLSQTGKVIQ